MIFIVPRAEFNCPRCARAITISPRADKFHIALLLMLLLIQIIFHPIKAYSGGRKTKSRPIIDEPLRITVRLIISMF